MNEQQLPDVADLVQESATIFASLAYGRISAEQRDLEQARVAIEALKALLDVLPEEKRNDFRAVMTNLQLAYADAAATAE